MEKTNNKKIWKNILTILLIILILSVYPVYAVVIWNVTKSSSSFSEFPSSGNWVCETEGFTISMTILPEEERLDRYQATIYFDEQTYNLTINISPGHGTPLVPVSPSTTIRFICEEEYFNLNFYTSKYKIEENQFTLLSIKVEENDSLQTLNKKMDMLFIKKEIF